MKTPRKTFVGLCLTISPLFLAGAAAQQAGAQDTKDAKPAAVQPEKEREKENEKEAVPQKVVPEKDAIKQLVGGYRIVSGEASGKQILPERLADVTVRITEKTITTYDGDRQQRFSATYRLDTDQRPWRIKMLSQGSPDNAANKNTSVAASNVGTSSEGLIELTEKGAKLIYALPSGETPRNFKTANLQQQFVLERLQDPAEKPKSSRADATPATADDAKADK